MLNKIIKASRDPAFAKAYLQASEDRAADALPYGPPDGAAGRVSYVYTMTGSQTDNRTSAWAGWALVLLMAVGAVVVAWRRLQPVSPGAAAEPAPVGAEPVFEEPAPEPADVVVAAPTTSDNDWLFRPPDEQPPN